VQLEALKRNQVDLSTIGRPQSATTYVTKVVQPTATVSSKPVTAPGAVLFQVLFFVNYSY
jgi:hypothetical protein